MLGMKYKESQGHTLVIHHSATRGVTALLVYEDDIIVTSNDMAGMETLRGYLVKEFDIKELHILKYFLGIKVPHSKQRILISQHKYIIC